MNSPELWVLIAGSYATSLTTWAIVTCRQLSACPRGYFLRPQDGSGKAGRMSPMGVESRTFGSSIILQVIKITWPPSGALKPSVAFHFLFSAGILQRNILSSKVWNVMFLVSLIRPSVCPSLVGYSERPGPFAL